MDVYRCADFVDSVLFIAAPLNSENRADAAALSVEATIARCANSGRKFTSGLYLGRHVNADLYDVVSPAEAIATQIAHGADCLHVYGYSGLDDGWVLYRMDDPFMDSVKDGTTWARAVIPHLSAPRGKQVAILFPERTSLLEPVTLDVGGRHRTDLLGWFRQFSDLGWQVDIVHPRQVVSGALADYRHLVIPVDPLYDLDERLGREGSGREDGTITQNAAVEAAVRRFAEDGGMVFHGPGCVLAQRTFGLTEADVPFDCIAWAEAIIPHGWRLIELDRAQVPCVVTL